MALSPIKDVTDSKDWPPTITHENHPNSLWNLKSWKDKLFPCGIIFLEKLKKALEIYKRDFNDMYGLREETFEKIDHHASTNSCSKNLGSAMSLLVLGMLMKC